MGIGQALYNYGPLSILLGYTITGFAIYFMMLSLVSSPAASHESGSAHMGIMQGEMATWLPLPGAIPQMCARYVDPAMGFAVGWNQWYSNALTQCSEISAAAALIGYWAPDISPAPWVALVVSYGMTPTAALISAEIACLDCYYRQPEHFRSQDLRRS